MFGKSEFAGCLFFLPIFHHISKKFVYAKLPFRVQNDNQRALEIITEIRREPTCIFVTSF